MSSLVMEIEDYALPAGQQVPVSRKATYFLLMTGSDVDVEFSYRGARIGGGKGLQGGDAVGPLTQPYDQVTLTSATAQTVKIATSSDPVTITRLSGVVRVAGTVTTTTVPDDTWPGFSILKTADAESGTYATGIFRNPAGSGKVAYISRIGMSPTAAGNHYINVSDTIPEVLDGDMQATGAPHDFERGDTSVLLRWSASGGLPNPLNTEFTRTNDFGYRKLDFEGNAEFVLTRPLKLAPGRDLLFFSLDANIKIGAFIEYEERDL